MGVHTCAVVQTRLDRGRSGSAQAAHCIQLVGLRLLGVHAEAATPELTDRLARETDAHIDHGRVCACAIDILMPNARVRTRPHTHATAHAHARTRTHTHTHARTCTHARDTCTHTHTHTHARTRSTGNVSQLARYKWVHVWWRGGGGLARAPTLRGSRSQRCAARRAVRAHSRSGQGAGRRCPPGNPPGPRPSAGCRRARPTRAWVSWCASMGALRRDLAAVPLSWGSAR